MFTSSRIVVRRLTWSGVLAAAMVCAPRAQARWEARNSGTSSYLAGVQCLSSTNAWAVGGDGALHSEDGGDTWVPVKPDLPSPLVLWNGLDFASPSVGWLSGLKGMGRTTDAGGTWYGIELDDAIDDNPPLMNAISAVSENEAWTVGVAMGEPEPGVIVPLLSLWRFRRTEDHWEVLENHLRAQGIFSDVQFLTPDDGFAVGYTGVPEPEGIIARISNASIDAHYDPQDSGGGFYLEGLFMLDLQHGWIVGEGGVILRTSNGGNIWSTQPSGTVARLDDVHFLNAQRGWAVGGGALLETHDGGMNWVQSESAPEVGLHGVHFCDAEHGFAVGDGGALLKWVPARCGDEHVDSGEECDLGEDVNGQEGACCTATCTLAESGAACDDGDPCTIAETCSGSVCGAGAPKCTSDDDCVEARCQAQSGLCFAVSKPDGAPCGAGVCEGGSCGPSSAGGTGGMAVGGAAGEGDGDDGGDPGEWGTSASGGTKSTMGGGGTSASGGTKGSTGGRSTSGDGDAGEPGESDRDPQSRRSSGCGACTVGDRTEEIPWVAACAVGLIGLLGARRHSRVGGKNLQ